jgi:septal ring factor EnvC (AmiA/AmiB activator)
MKEWLPAILTLVGAGGSLVFLFISLKVKRDVEETVKTSMEPFVQNVAKVQSSVEKVTHDLSKLYTQIAQQESRCKDLFVGRAEWDRFEKVKEKYLQRVEEQNTRLEDDLRSLEGSLREVLKHVRANGLRPRS